jgi:hypothetical protein
MGSGMALASDGTTVGAGATATITGPDGVCKQVTNNNGSNTMYVATTSVAEWQNFYNNPNGATVAACASPCTLPWGGSISSGASVTAYQTSSVACGSSCVSQTRTCTNGTLSGTYTNASCSVASCNCAAQTVTWTSGVQGTTLGSGSCAKAVAALTNGQAVQVQLVVGCDQFEGFVDVKCVNGALAVLTTSYPAGCTGSCGASGTCTICPTVQGQGACSGGYYSGSCGGGGGGGGDGGY